MAINLKFDLIGNPEPPSIVLANRSGNKLGQLNVSTDSIDVKDSFNDASEFSFTLNKYIDGEITPLWDKVVDFKLVNCPEWDMWFEIKVELDEATETVKTVYCTQLGQAELSQIMVYNIEINTEADIEREDYKTSILYDENNPKSSILHRLLEKAPHYSIAYVDESIQRIQRQFSFDDTSICDAFNEIAEEIGCLFVYNSNSQAGGKPNRTISVYDLQQNCNNKECKHRGEFTDKCPKCGSTDIKYGYGEDTLIFVTADELATEGIQLVTDTDSVKNCFKLEAGDDLMTATIRNCNPNGSDYIWYFSDSMKEDMSKELVDRIESYDELYKKHYNNHMSKLNETLVNQYNNLVAKYDDYYNTKSTCLDCKNEGNFEEQCSNPECNSKNILVGQKLQAIPITIKGYPALMTAYYNTIDLLLYLESGLMPNVEMSGTTAKEQVELLTTSSLSPVAVNVKDINNASEATANSAVLSMAKVLIKPTYKVDIVDGSSSLSQVDSSGKYKTWTGKFVVTNYSDDKDTAESDEISVEVNNAAETFIQQKIDKALNKANTDDYSIAGLFAKDYDDFCNELKKYALNPLDSFSKACDTCISILTEQGTGNEDEKPELYTKLYKPYFDKQQAINDEIKVREDEIAIIEGIWDNSDENNPKCITSGLQQYIEDCQKEIQDILNFENHLGEDLWLEFCAYRREDKYSNSNYISDGLDNAELFKKANEFIEVAEEEIFKSAELQHSISATLNNLLALPKFKPLLESFKTGNWIRVQVDDKVYKLRLLEFGFEYGDSENISVEFSDVTKIKNGMTDVQDVFEQASSMTSSYDSVQRQAQKGNVARSTIDQWIVDGLNSANVQIQSNDSEEIVLTQSGLLARSYDDIAGTYSPEQFKLTHNILAYTDDNWGTVSAALGKHNYKYYKDGNFVDAEGYGLSAKFAQAAYIIGSQMIGGEIVSSNYQPKIQGTHINLLNGEFDFAGGKIVYDIDGDDPKKSTLTLKGVTIQWDGDDAVNPPAIEDISDLSDEIDKINKTNNALFSTTISEKSVISPLIVGGYLNIKNDADKTGVIIDPNGLVNSDYVFRVYNDKGTAVGLDVNGNAEFSGTITASNIIGKSTLQVGAQYDEDNNVTGYLTTIDSNGRLTCVNADVSGDITADSLTLRKQIQLGNETDGYHTWINPDGTLSTQDANISGEIRAASGQIGGFTIEPTETAEDGSTSGGWLYSSGKTLGSDKSIFLSATNMSGTVNSYNRNDWRLTVGSNFGVTSDGTTYATNAVLNDCTITSGTLQMGTYEDGYSVWVSADEGILNAYGANISGKITAVDGEIGGWKINRTSISKDTICLNTNDNITLPSLVSNSGATSRVSFYSGEKQSNKKVEVITLDGDGNLFYEFETNSPAAEASARYYEYVQNEIDRQYFTYNGQIGDSTNEDIRISFSNIDFINSYSYITGCTPQISYGAITINKDDIKIDNINKMLIVPYEVTGSLIEESGRPYEIKLDIEYVQIPQSGYNKVNEENIVVNGNLVTIIEANCGDANSYVLVEVTYYSVAYNFSVLADGSLYAGAAQIRGTVYADNGEFRGTVYADNGEFSGDIYASSGAIAGFKIEKDALIATRGMKLQGGNTAYIGLNTLSGGTSNNYTIGIEAWGADGKIHVRIISDKELLESATYQLRMKVIVYDIIGNSYYYTSTTKLTIPKDSTISDWCHPWSDKWIGDTYYAGTFEANFTHLAGQYHDADKVKLKNLWDASKSSPYKYQTNSGFTSFTMTQNTSSQIEIRGSLIPTSTSTNKDTGDTGWNLGLWDNRWNDVYCINLQTASSDRNLKNTINDLDESYSRLFDKLRPVTYKFNSGTSGRLHSGFIAQEVKDALDDVGIDSQNFAAYCSWEREDGTYGYGLRYGEFIALCVNEIQKLKKRVAELENK